MLSRPNSRAFSHRSSPLAAETVLAIRFHCSGELSTQNRAISVWSAVRALGVVMPSPPRRFTSLKSAVYLLEVTAYGGPGRNCELSRRTKGVTSAHPGANAKSNPGVKRYSPGCVPCGYAVSNKGVSDPSPSPQGQDGRSSGLSQGNTLPLGSTVRDGPKRGRIGIIHTLDRAARAIREGRRELLEEWDQHVSRRRSHGSIGRGSWFRSSLEDVGTRATVDRVQRVVDSQVHGGIETRFVERGVRGS